MEISAALNKAVAIVGADNDITDFTVPDNNVGWGRVNLSSSLYFAGDTVGLWVEDNRDGVETGGSAVYAIDVTDYLEPLRVALCWSDYPGTMQAATILVNDLDLTVISPTGVGYKGNVYSGGRSRTGGAYDTLNVEECVRIETPATGQWIILVQGRNVPVGPQPFGLAATGIFGETAPRRDVGVRQILAPVGQVEENSLVIPRATVFSNSTAAETMAVVLRIGTAWADTQRVAIAPGRTDTVRFAEWPATPIGWATVVCTTMLAGDEEPANDAVLDSVEVIPVGAVAEENSFRFALASPTPNPFSRSTTIRFSLPERTEVNLAVYSATGALVRTLAHATLAPGHHLATWNRQDARGRRAGAGVYFVRIRTGTETASRKVVLR